MAQRQGAEAPCLAPIRALPVADGPQLPAYQGASRCLLSALKSRTTLQPFQPPTGCLVWDFSADTYVPAP